MKDKSQSSDDVILELIIAHEPLLRHIIGLGVQSPADIEDVFQETVLVIIEYFRRGGQVKHPKAWMVKIAKRKCIDFHRRAKRDRDREVDLVSFISPAAFGGGVSLADEQHQRVVVKEIRNVIARMNPIHREVGELHIQGYTAREISESLGIPEGTVKSRTRKFRQLIRAYLEMDILVPKQRRS